MSCQLDANTSPTNIAINTLISNDIFLTIFLSTLACDPTKKAGKTETQTLFDRLAIKKFKCKKITENKATAKNIPALALIDLIKICSCPTSDNHHQSTIKATRLENKKKNNNNPINEIFLKIFDIIVLNNYKLSQKKPAMTGYN